MTLVLSMGVVCAHAVDSAKVYVSVADDKGELAVAAEELTVTDVNKDDKLSVYDVIYCAHEAFYEGGAAEGFATEVTEWGVSITKMWGVSNGGSYGYMINNVMASGMDDPVKDDDYVAMYVFTEPVKLLDKYSYFDRFKEDVEAGEVTLTLTKQDFDRDWHTILLPVEGATIIVDGKAIDAKTDVEGKVTFTLDVNGEHIVSAKAEDQVLVPPVYKANVTGGKDPATPDELPTMPEETVAPTDEDTATQAVTEAATDPATKDSATNDSATKDSSSSTPQTGDSTNLYLWLMITLVSFLGICATVIYRKKHAEK